MKNVTRVQMGIAIGILVGALVLGGCPAAGVPVDAPPGAPPVSVPASAPASLSASGVTHSEATLSWQPVVGATGYVLVRDIASDGPYASVVFSGSDTSASDTGLTPQTIYYYRVRATNSAGSGPLSEPVSVTTSAAPVVVPVTPTGFVANAVSESTVALVWDSTVNTNGYRIYRGTSEPVALDAPVHTGSATSYSDTGLAAETTYYYALVAWNAAGASAAATLSAQTTAIPVEAPAIAPANLGVSTVSTTELSVSWDAVAGAATYTLYRATDAGMTGETSVYTGALGSFTDTGLTPTADYYYEVVAENAAGAGPRSAPESGTTLPPAPAGLAAEQSPGNATTELLVSWNAIDASGTSTAVMYVLEQALSSTGPFTLAYEGSDSEVTVDDLTPGTQYFFRVQAVLGPLESATSGTRTGTTQAVLAAPGGLSVGSATGTSLQASWNPVSDAESYYVYRSASPGGPWTEAGHVTSGETLTDAGLSSGTLYYYIVRAYAAAAGLSPASGAASGTTSPGVPQTPDGLQVTVVSATRLSVSWSLSPGATSYVVTRNGTQLPEKVSSSFADTNLDPDTSYTYAVAAKNASGTSSPSAGVTATTLPAPPAAPTNVAVSDATSSSLTLSWDLVSGATSYKIYRSPEGGSYSYVSLETNGPFVDTGRTADTTYFYRVRAVNSGGESEDSAPDSGTTLPGLGTPSWGYNWTTDTTISLSWSIVSGATGYRLHRAASASGPWTNLVYEGAEPSAVDTGLAPDTRYHYRVRAYDASEEGSFSTVFSLWTDPSAGWPPGAPDWLYVGARSAETVTLSWDQVYGATGYIVYRSDSFGVSESDTAIDVGHATSWIDTGLVSEQTYWYAVQAVNSAGHSGLNEYWSSVTTYGIPNVPNLWAGLVTENAARLEWSGVGGALEYELYRSLDPTVTESDILLYAGPGLEYQDIGLDADTIYYYGLRATNEAGTSSLDDITVTTAADPIPSPLAPELVMTWAGNHSVGLKWTSVPDITGYVLYRSADTSALGEPATVLAHLDPWTTVYQDYDIDSADQYYYAVRAVAFDVDGALSNAVRAGGISVIIE